MRVQILTSFSLFFIVAIRGLEQEIFSSNNEFPQSSENLNVFYTEVLFYRCPRSAVPEFVTEVEKMQSIARLTTAIEVQVALANGKIDKEALFNRLLLLGNVTSKQVRSMKDAKMSTVITTMKELPGKLEHDDSSRRGASKLDLIDKLRVLVDGVDVKKWDGGKEFLDEMTVVGKEGVDMKDVEEVKEVLKDCVSNMDFVKKLDYDPKNANHKASAPVYIKGLIDCTKDLSVQIKDLPGKKKTTWEYPTIKSASESLTPLRRTVDAVRQSISNAQMLQLQSGDEDDVKSYAVILQSLSDAAKTVNDVLSSLRLARILTTSERYSNSASLKYAGFLHGLADINGIFVDLADRWIREMINVEKMMSSLQPLKRLIPPSELIGKALAPPTGDQRLIRSEFFDTVDRILAAADSKEADDVVQKYLACCKSFIPTGPVPSMNDIDDFLKTADDMDSDMRKSDGLVKTLIGILDKNDVKSWLEETQKLAVVPTDDSQIGAVINTLKSSKGVNELHAVIKKAQDAINNPDLKIKGYADDLIKKKDTVDNFYASLSSYGKIVQCIQAVDKKKAERLASSMAMVETYKKVDRKVVSHGEDVVHGLLSTDKHFKDLEDAVAGMRGQSNAEVFRALADLEKNAEVIGRATRGISAMKQVMEKKAQADIVMKSWSILAAHLDNPQLDPADKKNIEAMMKLNTTLAAMYVKLDQWKNGVKENVGDLGSHSNLFESATSIAGIDGNTGQMVTSVDNLAVLVSDPGKKNEILKVKRAIQTLDIIGLNFAAYHSAFGASKDSLIVFDNFFAQSKAVPENTGYPWYAYVSSSVLGLLVFVFGAIVVVLCLNRKKEKKNRKSNDGKNSEENKKLLEEPKEEKQPVQTPKEEINGLAKSLKVVKKSIGDSIRRIKKTASRQFLSEATALVQDKGFFNLCHPKWKRRIFDQKAVVCPQKNYDNMCLDLEKKIFRSQNIFITKNEVTEDSAKLLKNKEKKKKENGDDPMLPRAAAIKKFCGTALRVINREMVNPDKVVMTERNVLEYPVTRNGVIESTCVKLKDYGKLFVDSFIDANYVTFENGLEMILTRTPVIEKRDPENNIRQYSTVEKYCWMIKQEKSKFVINMCGPFDDPKFLEFDPTKANQSKRYNKLTIVCLEVSKYCENDKFFERKISIRFDGYPEHIVTMYQAEHNWTEEIFPSDPAPVVKLLKKLETCFDPIIVHCPTGSGRSAMVAHIFQLQQLCSFSKGAEAGAIPYAMSISQLRQMRHDAIMEEHHLVFAYAAVLLYCRGDKDEHESAFQFFAGFSDYWDYYY